MILAIDDEPESRTLLTQILTAEGYRVRAADSGELALAALELKRPELILLDIRMPEMDGIEATRRITSDPSVTHTRVLILTTFELDEYVFGALDAGASGFLLKGGEPADLVHAIQVVAAGDSLLAPSVTRRLIETYVSRPEPQPAAEHHGLGDLTSREREVLELVAHGLTNAEIAQTLQLSPLTAKTHVSRILMKLGARDRVQLVVIAYQTGVVDTQPQS